MTIITSHSAGAVVIVQIQPDGTVYCAKMKYITDRSWSFRHMMETGERGETVIETLRNGLLDEIARDKNNFEYRLMQNEPILVEFHRDEKNPGGTHMKVFFLVQVTQGHLRDQAISDGKNTTLDRVGLCEIAGLITVTEGKAPPIHVKASKAAILALAVNKAVFDRYHDLIISNVPQQLTDEEMRWIDAYPYKW